MRHFWPVGNPAPPRPRRPDCSMVAMICFGREARRRFPAHSPASPHDFRRSPTADLEVCLSGFGNLRYGLRPLHSQAPRQRRKAIVGEVFVQVQRVEPPIVLHRDVDLPVEEGLFAHSGSRPGGQLPALPDPLPPAARPGLASRAAQRGMRDYAGGSASGPTRLLGPR